MIRLIFIFCIIGFGLFIGTNFSDQQGYVMISVAGKIIEMSFVTLLLCIIALVAIFFLLDAIISKIFTTGSHTWNWFSIRKQKQAQHDINISMMKLLEGDWKGAQKKAANKAKYHSSPILGYLIASEAALAQNDLENQEKYLQLAAKQDPENLALKLAYIKQLHHQQKYQESCPLLEDVVNDYPHHSRVLTLQKVTYIQLGQWQKLIDLVPKLKKYCSLTSVEEQRLLYMAQAGLINQASEKGTEGLLTLWGYLPKKVKQDPIVIQNMAEKLIETKGDSEAYVILRDALKNTPSDNLFNTIASLDIPDLHPAIKLLEKNAQSMPNNPALQSALGQLYSREQNWPKAQQALESALKQKESASDYILLAKVLDKQDMKQAANDVSRKALTLHV